jgi:tetratricopeptide (TPR) repeat protein
MALAWNRVREVVLAALEREPADRRRFVESACGDDDELRAEVESLLAAEAASTAISRYDAAAIAANAGSELTPRPGMLIGRYLLRREIASGGMGTVFEAEQFIPSRIVALKTIRVGLTKDLSSRFRFEAEALARLQHPNIAQIFDAGIHEEVVDGRRLECPYFAMELVVGARPLTTFATERRLPLSGRLRLFMAVADAVHYGHQRGVIHRDLKPGNVLVDDQENPKIIDYGVARFTDNDPRSSVQTLAGEIIGTLMYMSPEQLRGDRDAVDVRSDVYSLGAMLHELLCGEPPFDVRERTIVDAIQIITNSEPRSPRTVNRELPGEIDWIVAKALARDPDRRYRSASELRADIERFLSNEPLEAGPPSAVYRLRKFGRRHRVLLGALGSVIVSLAVGLALSLHGRDVAVAAEADAKRAQRDAELARDEAKAEAARANENFAFVRRIFETARSDTGKRDATVKDLLAAAASRIDAELQAMPFVESAVRWMIGTCYLTFDDVENAAIHIERAIELRSEHLGENALETLECRVMFGTLQARRGKWGEAEREYRTAAEGLDRTEDPAAREPRVVAWSGLGTALETLGRMNEAESAHRRAVAIAAEHFEATELQAMAESQFCNTLELAGKEEEALALSRRALERWRSSERGNQHFAVQIRMSAARRLAKLDAAAMVDELESLYDEVSRNEGSRHVLSIVVLHALGLTRMDAGDHPGASRDLENAVSVAREVDGEGAWTTTFCRTALGRALSRCDRHEEAETILREGAVHAANARGESDWYVIEIRQELVDFLLFRNRLDEAEAAQRPLLALCRDAQGRTGPHTIHATMSLAKILEKNARHDEIEALLGPFVEECRADLGGEHATTLESLARLGSARFRAGRFVDAVVPLERAYAGLEAKGRADPAFAAIAFELGIVRRESGDLAGSEHALKKCVEVRRATLPSGDPSTGEAEVELAKTVAARGN